MTGIDAALAPGGRITGRVTDLETGAALAGVRVRALLPDLQPWWPWRSVRSAVTGADGRYAIEGLWTDVYHVDFLDEAGDHATVQYGDGSDVGLLVGEETGGIDASLPHEGRVAGRVTDSLTGAGLAGVTVSVYNYMYEATATVQTDGQGWYEAGSLPAGEYIVRFGKVGYAEAWYDGKMTEDDATMVTVRVAETTGGIDGVLTLLSGVRGQMTDAISGQPLAGIDVRMSGGRIEWRAWTESDGTYELSDVPPDQYHVVAHDPQGIYRDASAMGPDGSENVVVEPGQTLEGVDAALIPWSASNRKIMGTVADVVTGEPLAGIRTTLYYCSGTNDRECSDLAVSVSDGAGQYMFREPAEEAEYIRFSDPSGIYLEQKTTNFRLPGPDETVVVDAALQRYDRVYGGLAGQVTAIQTGEPLGGQRVCVFGSPSSNSRCVDTAADGTYRIDGLQEGAYKVAFAWDSWLGDRYGQWYWGGDAQGTDVMATVRPNEVTANINGALYEQGRIAGTIRSRATGEPIAGALVEICGGECDRQTTGADGAYLSDYLPSRAFFVHALKTGYAQRYYRDTVDGQQAEAITVTYESLTSGVDISLPLPGSIAGQVTDAQTGAPVEGLGVSAQGAYYYSAKTDAQGRYAIGGLDEGAYSLRFEDSRQRYATWAPADPVKVGTAETITFDAQVMPNGYITGRVTAAESGGPLLGIVVRAGSLAVYTAVDGTYRIGPLPDGEYTVRFSDESLWRRAESSQPVGVKAGETVTNVDQSMILLGIARGRVVDADTGAPVYWVRVYGRGEYGKYNTIYTDEDGRFEIPGLNEGTYALQVQDRTHVYADGPSEVLTIQAGTVIEGLEIKLHKWGEFGGTVTDAETGEPVAGVWVQLYSVQPFVAEYAYAITGADGTYRIGGMGNWTLRPVFSDPKTRYHAQSYGGGKSLLDSQTATFKPGADTLGVGAALARREDAPPVEQSLWNVWLPVGAR